MHKPMINDYLYKPRMQTARNLHKLYNQDLVNVPNVEDIVLNRIRIAKQINEDLKDLIDKDSADADVMELCMLIDVDFEDIEPINRGGGF